MSRMRLLQPCCTMMLYSSSCTWHADGLCWLAVCRQNLMTCFSWAPGLLAVPCNHDGKRTCSSTPKVAGLTLHIQAGEHHSCRNTMLDGGRKYDRHNTDLISIIWLCWVHQEISQPFQVLALAFHQGRVREACLHLSQVGGAALQVNLLFRLSASNCLEHEQAKSIHI